MQFILCCMPLNFKDMDIMSDIRWTNGKEECTREEVSYMLESQIAMISNDLKDLLIKQAEAKGLKGKLTKEGGEIIDNVNDCRKVVF